MDTSEEYIEMCRKSPEIQLLWKKEYGDFVVVETDYGDKVKTIFDGADDEYDSSTNHISPTYWNIVNTTWLPRQDQLQTMITNQKLTLINRFYDFTHSWMIDFRYPIIENNFSGPWEMFNSLEQLWLAFVMKEKFSKLWNGDDWIYDKTES